MIKNRLMTLATISFLTLTAASAQAGLLNPFSNPAKVESQKVHDVFAGLRFNYLDQEDRLLVLNDFLKQVELEYALLPLKEKRIGLEYKKLKEEARLAEIAVVDILASSADRKDPELREKITLLQAQSNLDFLDRMQLLVAKFKDTHFSLQEKISRPLVYNGIRLFRIDGKILVGSLETRFLSMVSKMTGVDLLASIKIGDEVLEIDGVKVEDKINELKPYIAGSSEGFIDNYAVRALTLRNFKYEKKNYMKITFKNAGTFKIPLFVNNAKGATPRLDAITFFEKYKIPSDSVAIGMTFDKATNTWSDSALTFTGYSTRLLAANLKGVTEYADDAGGAGLRTGYYIQKGKTYAVMQLLTFYTKNFKTGTAQPASFIDTIRKFILEVKEQELPLILDLRVNGGGNGSFPAQVLSLLAPANTIYPGPTAGYRMTQYMRNIQDPSNYQEIVAEDITSGLTLDEFMKVFDDTLADRKEYTPMMSFGSIATDPKVNGFNNKIVALVTPDCVSACDKMSFLLKSSGRAIIIGSTSNGTGAGYLSTEDFNTNWEDRLKVLSTQFPNYLFGKPGDSEETTIFGEQSVDELCSENKPTIADIPYSSKVIDLAKNNLGWLQRATQVLDVMTAEE